MVKFKSLLDVVAQRQPLAQRPFPEYQNWWRMGPDFLSFMAAAIVAEWAALPGNSGDLTSVGSYVAEYLHVVFAREPRTALVADFVQANFVPPVYSGEFDALSYAFFRDAFTQTASQPERRLFTKRVGRRFFSALANHLALVLPTELQTAADFHQLQANINQVGAFLKDQGYLRDHFAFTFDVQTSHGGQTIAQNEAHFLTNLHHQGLAYALYEMGYPVILPSAVYLFHTIGEAQHHSSRTIEELFERVGYEARETDDFDPSGYPPDRVVELWEIRK